MNSGTPDNLLVKPHPRDAAGCVLSVTPESAGWTHVGFEVFNLKPGERLSRTLPDREACLVLLSGRASISAGAFVETPGVCSMDRAATATIATSAAREIAGGVRAG